MRYSNLEESRITDRQRPKPQLGFETCRNIKDNFVPVKILNEVNDRYMNPQRRGEE